MDLNEAVKIAQQLKNHYRAFEKIEEVVREAESYGELLKHKKKEIEKANSEAEEAERVLEKVQGEISIANLYKDETESKIKTLQIEYLEKKKEAEKQHQIKLNALSALEKQEELKHNRNMGGYAKKEEDMGKRIEQLKKEYDGMVEKIKKMVG